MFFISENKITVLFDKKNAYNRDWYLDVSRYQCLNQNFQNVRIYKISATDNLAAEYYLIYVK